MTKKRAGALTLLCGLVATMTGCATLLSGTHQTVTIDSYPQGAQVRVGNQTGITPVTFHVSKGKDYTVEFSHVSGKRVMPLERSVDPMTLLNIIPPLWPGFIVDALTGAFTHYDPDVVYVDFTMPPHPADAQLTGFRR